MIYVLLVYHDPRGWWPVINVTGATAEEVMNDPFFKPEHAVMVMSKERHDEWLKKAGFQ